MKMAKLCRMTQDEVAAVKNAWKLVMDSDYAEHGAKAIIGYQ